MLKNSDYLLLLLKHMEWADKKVWNSLVHNQVLLNNEKIKKLFYHIYAVQHAFVSIRIGEKTGIKELSAFSDILEIKSWGEDYYFRLNKFFIEKTGTYTDKTIRVKRAVLFERQTGKKPDNFTLGESIIHVSVHSAYQYGQVNTALREAGGNPDLVDFITWGRLGKPSPDQPAVFIK